MDFPRYLTRGRIIPNFYTLEVILSIHLRIILEHVSLVSYHGRQKMTLWRQFLIRPSDFI